LALASLNRKLTILSTKADTSTSSLQTTVPAETT
jgi:hypothetical protein